MRGLRSAGNGIVLAQFGSRRFWQILLFSSRLTCAEKQGSGYSQGVGEPGYFASIDSLADDLAYVVKVQCTNCGIERKRMPRH